MIEQGTAAWLELRLGKVTASRVADVVAKTKTGYSASRANYMAQLVAERLTGTVQDSYQSDAMRWGTNVEDEARAAYEFRTGEMVETVGFIPHPRIEMSGASPDGFVADRGLIEIKCPNTATHIETLLGQNVPGKYITQIQWQLASTGRDWCDFVSFDPRLSENMHLFVRRVERDDKRIKELEDEVSAFLNELAEKVDALQKAYGEAA